MSTALPPGLHFGISPQVYHADPAEGPSLSSTAARTILAKSLAHTCAEHPRLGRVGESESTDAMDRGSIVHALLAGQARESIAVADFATFRSKAAQEWAASVRAAGKVPALVGDMEEASKIAAAVMKKAAAGLTDDPFQKGKHEVTAIWQRNGAHYRARYDCLVMPDGEPWTIWDWKVTGDVSVSEVKRKIRRFGYHIQAAHYLNGLNVLCPKFAGRHSFVFVFVEDAPPHSVRRYCLKTETLSVAAIDLSGVYDQWEDALKTGVWPDASRNETTHIDVPTFADDDDEPDQIQAAA